MTLRNKAQNPYLTIIVDRDQNEKPTPLTIIQFILLLRDPSATIRLNFLVINEQMEVDVLLGYGSVQLITSRTCFQYKNTPFVTINSETYRHNNQPLQPPALSPLAQEENETLESISFYDKYPLVMSYL